MQQEDIRRQWDSRIAELARRVNLGWWLERWLPMALGVCLAGAAALLTVRTLGVAHEAWQLPVIGGAIMLSMIVAWLVARRRFESREAARVRLEDALGLKTRLSAAAEGVGSWPELREMPTIVTWRWQRPLAFFGAGVTLLLLAGWVPVSALQPSRPRVIEKPSAVKQVEAWVEQLKKDDALSPQSIEDVEKKIEELMRRPNDQWYEHASLEASEHLRDETGKNLQELGTQLEQTQGSLNTLAELGNAMSEEAKQGITKQMQTNMQGMRSGAMQANSSLMDQLKNMDPKAMSGMSKEQMQKLADRLKQNADALRKALANAPQFDFKECKCSGDGDKQGNKPGKGGIQRGRGDAELTVKEDETNLNQKRTETASTLLDPERVTPGDMLGLQDAKPTVDENGFKGTQAGGGLQSAGQGGASVEKTSLVPEERAVLKRFFK